MNYKFKEKNNWMSKKKVKIMDQLKLQKMLIKLLKHYKTISNLKVKELPRNLS